jgi:hypothetical protein
MKRFRVRQKVRVKRTATAIKLLHRVHLSEWHRGQHVTITTLRDSEFGGLQCHKVVDDSGNEFWMPPAVLEKI